ncbi:MAG: PGF-pre-PGF domain-containing protein [archaeon]
MSKEVNLKRFLGSAIFLFAFVFAAGFAATTVDLLSPPDNNWTNLDNSTTPFIFQANDTADIILNCSLTVAGANVSANASVFNATPTTFYANSSFALGASQWNVTCYNTTSGISAARTLNFDSINPVAASVSPDNYFNSSSRNVTFQLQGVDNLNLTGLTLYGNWSSGWHANATNSTPVNGTTWTVNVTGIPDGIYTWSAYAADAAGNWNFSANRTLVVDATAPTVTLTAPVNATNSSIPAVQINYTVSDAIDSAGVWCKPFILNGSTWTNLSYFPANTVNYTVAGDDGTYLWNYQCQDSAGNAAFATANRSFTIDTAFPGIAVVSPAIGENLTVSAMAFNVSVSDISTSLVWYSLLNATSDVIVQNTTMTGGPVYYTASLPSNFSLYPPGMYQIIAYANDSVGHANATGILPFGLAAVNATQIEGMVSNAIFTANFTNTNGTEFSGDIQEDTEYNLVFNVTGSGIVITLGNFSAADYGQASELNATAQVDVTGLESALGIDFYSFGWLDIGDFVSSDYYDYGKIQINSTADLAYYLGGSKDDPTSTLASACNATFSNYPCYNVSGSATTIYVSAFSGGGVGNDTTAPSVSLTTPAGSAHIRGTYDLTGTYTDGIGVTNVTYYYTSFSNLIGYSTTSPHTVSWNTALVSDGTYTIIVNATDAKGNKNSTNATGVVIDNTAPTVTAFSLSTTSAYSGNTITATCTGSDASGTVATTVGNLDYSTVGTRQASCTITDQAGNTAVSYLSYTILASSSSSAIASGTYRISENIPEGTVSIVIDRVIKGQLAKFAVIPDALRFDVTAIELETLRDLVGVKINIRGASAPSLPLPNGSGKVRAYLEISRVNFEDSAVGFARIRFSVPKEWVAANLVDPAKIFLYRLEGNSWNKLSTSLLSQDSQEYVFEAQTPGFSTFAIAGAVNAPETAAPAPGETPENQPPQQEGATTTVETTTTSSSMQAAGIPANASAGKPAYIGIVAILLVVALVAGGAYYYFVILGKEGKPKYRFKGKHRKEEGEGL